VIHVTAATKLHSAAVSAKLHFMKTSATSCGRRAARKRETEQRIHRCALLLTDERGLEGWTMDELAAAADVSRRTLFNYYPGKSDAVLGGPPELPADALAAFDAGGPTGRLVDDLAALASALLSEKDFDPEFAATARRIVHATPRLMAVVHERFEQVTQELVDHILRREGVGFGERRARLLLGLLVAVFDDALRQVQDDPTGPTLLERFDDNVRQARELLT
jgi:AcrR family transcriptional regulator